MDPLAQLTLDLAVPEPPTFANFVVVEGNREAVGTLGALAAGTLAETGVVLWGAPGAGKSHLLRACVAAARAAGRPGVYLEDPRGAGEVVAVAGGLVAVDAADSADDAAQGALFTLYNALAACGGHLLAATSQAPARLSLRPDLRTRLGYGLVYEVVPLADADKPAALAGYARSRGFRLGDDVIAYLLAHGRRDMATLVATLSALDRASLAAQRPITLPFLRAWLARNAG